MKTSFRSVAFGVVTCSFLTVWSTQSKAQLVSTEDLRRPATLTCIYVPSQMSFKAERGLMKVVWEWKLEKGPYVSEWEDDQGTFYRAPPGGAFAGRTDSLEKPSGPLTHRTSDGGFWMPRDPKAAPRLYAYFSTADAPKVVPAENENCSSLVVLKDPATSKHSVLAVATGGALGGAEAKAATPGSPASYGQAATGGAVAMGLVAAFINTGVGKIQLKPIDDEAFIAKLRDVAAQASPVKEGAAQAKP
jgi:hypothetical protein